MEKSLKEAELANAAELQRLKNERSMGQLVFQEAGELEKRMAAQRKNKTLKLQKRKVLKRYHPRDKTGKKHKKGNEYRFRVYTDIYYFR